MSTPVAQIVDFLLARIIEDEDCAREAVVTDDDLLSLGDPGVAHHVARFGSARVLAECKAKLDIVAAYPCRRRGDGGWDVPRVLYLMVQPYADHPDFDPGWRV